MGLHCCDLPSLLHAPTPQIDVNQLLFLINCLLFPDGTSTPPPLPVVASFSEVNTGTSFEELCFVYVVLLAQISPSHMHSGPSIFIVFL